MNEQELKNALDQIEISPEMQDRIFQRSKNRNVQKGEYYTRPKKKLVFVALAATLIIGASVFASTGIITRIDSSSSSKPDFTTLPTTQQMMTKVGYTGTLIEKFKNGYTFADGTIKSNIFKDDSNHAVEKTKSLSLKYKKGENIVDLYIEKFNSSLTEDGNITAKNGDIDIYTKSFVYKIVPNDYVKTEEELNAEEQGTLMFAYDGGDQVVESHFISAHWEKDNVRYILMQNDGELFVADLVDMANEIIESES